MSTRRLGTPGKSRENRYVRHIPRRIIDTAALVILRPINPAWMLVIGFFCVSWGLFVMAPWWSVTTSADIYAVIGRSLDEGLWGGIAVVAGALMMYGAVRPSYTSLWIGTAFAGSWWTYLSVTLWVSDPTNTGGLTYGFIAVFCALLYLNIRVNHELGHDWTGRGEEEHV